MAKDKASVEIAAITAEEMIKLYQALKTAIDDSEGVCQEIV